MDISLRANRIGGGTSGLFLALHLFYRFSGSGFHSSGGGRSDGRTRVREGFVPLHREAGLEPGTSPPRRPASGRRCRVRMPRCPPPLFGCHHSIRPRGFDGYSRAQGPASSECAYPGPHCPQPPEPKSPVCARCCHLQPRPWRLEQTRVGDIWVTGCGRGSQEEGPVV